MAKPNGTKFDYMTASLTEIGGKIADSMDSLVDAAAALWERYKVNDPKHEVYNELWTEVGRKKMQRMETLHLEKTDHDKFITLPEAPKAGKEPERYFALTPEFACLMTSNEFGKLKGEQPNLHKMVQERRDALSKHVSNYRTRFGGYLKVAETGGLRGPRAANRTFVQHATAVLKALPAKRKLAEGKESDLPSKDRLDRAIAAFWAELNKSETK